MQPQELATHTLVHKYAKPSYGLIITAVSCFFRIFQHFTFSVGCGTEEPAFRKKGNFLKIRCLETFEQTSDLFVQSFHLEAAPDC